MSFKIDSTTNFQVSVNLINDIALEVLSVRYSDDVVIAIDQFGYGMDDGASCRGYGFVARIQNLMVSVLPYNDIAYLDIHDVTDTSRDVVSVPVSNAEVVVSYIRDMLYFR